MNKARHISANMASAAFWKVISALAGMVTVAVVARQLGADGYGVVRTAMTFVAFAATFANLGLNYIMLREAAVDDADGHRIIDTAFGLRLFGTVAALIAGIAVAALMPWSTTVLAAIGIAALGMIAFQGSEIMTCVLQLRFSQGRAIMAEAIGAVVALLASIVAARAGLGVLAMTAASSLGLCVMFFLVWGMAARLGPVWPVVDPALWRRLVRPGIPVAVSVYFGLIALRGDILILSFVKPAADVGLYGIATKIYEVGLQLPVLFGGLLMPLFARAAHDPGQLRIQVAHALQALMIVGLGIALALGFFADEIVALLAGDGFTRAVPAVQIIGVCLGLAGCSAMLRYAAVAQGRESRLMRFDGIVTLLAVTAQLILIPRFSFLGAACGRLGAETITLTCLLFVAGRGIGGIPRPERGLRILLAGLLSAGVIALLRAGPFPVFVDAVLAAVAFAALLFATGALSPALVRTVLAPSSRN